MRRRRRRGRGGVGETGGMFEGRFFFIQTNLFCSFDLKDWIIVGIKIC